MARHRLDNIPAEILVEICRHLVLPMQSKIHGHGPSMKPQTDSALTCRATLARLMRTCRNLHDAAGCMLYSGYYQLWHPSDAYRFLKTLDPHKHEPYYNSSYARHLSPDDTQRQLVRHVDIHNNMDRRTLSDVPWTKDQATITDGTWVEEMASEIGMPFTEDWNNCRLVGDREPRDHAAEHINQLLLRYLSNLTTLKITLVFNWVFSVLEKWVSEQQAEHPSPFRNLRHLKIHLRSLQARSFNCLKVIMNNAPYLSTLEVYDTVSYRTPQHSRLEALRTLKFVNSSMDRGTMKVTLQAVPNITHFEYRHSVQNVIVDKQPTLTPQMLCQLLSNEYELTLPPPLNNRGQLAKATLPDLHRQLRTLIIDFPFYEGMEPWRNEEAIHDLRHFTKLRNLSININSIVCKAQGKQNMTINSLENIIPDNLETLEITRVGGYFQELIKNNLPNLAKVVKEGRFESLGRIEFTGYPGSKDAMIEVQSLLQKMFGWQKKLTIWVTGHVE